MNNTPITPEMPKVCSTRACSTYEPMQFMSEFQYDNGRRELYLEVKYRVDWFNHWCMEHHVEGNILDHSYEIIPEMRMILATSVVMMNDKEVARAIAGRAIPEDPTGMNVVVQSAFTCAKGRALANLGFGTTNGSTNENGEDLPPDSGIPINTPKNPEVSPQSQTPPPASAPAPVTAPVLPVVTPDTNPMMMGSGNPAVTEEAPKKRGRKPKNSQEVMAITSQPVVEPGAQAQMPVAPQPKVAAPMPQPEAPVVQQPAPTYNPQPAPVVSNAETPQTIEAARAFICPIGTGKGKTMGELYLTDRGKVEFFAGPKFASGDRHPALVAAAKMLLEQG